MYCFATRTLRAFPLLPRFPRTPWVGVASRNGVDAGIARLSVPSSCHDFLEQLAVPKKIIARDQVPQAVEDRGNFSRRRAGVERAVQV